MFPTNWTNIFDFTEKNTLKDQLTLEMKPFSYATKNSFLEMGIYDTGRDTYSEFYRKPLPQMSKISDMGYRLP